MIEQQSLALLERYIDGLLAEGDIPRLRALLRESSEARARLRSLATIDFGLHDLAGAYEGADRTGPLPGANGESPSHGSRGLRKTTWHYGLVVAATVLVVVGVQALWRSIGEGDPLVNTQTAQEDKPRYVASVVSLVDCRWARGQPALREGERLSATTVALESGAAEIRFDGGATLVLQGATECRIQSESKVLLLKGQASFRNAGNETFDLRTPGAVLGGRRCEFTVTVGAPREEVDVLRGEVRRMARNSPDDVDLILAGQSRDYGGAPVPTF